MFEQKAGEIYQEFVQKIRKAFFEEFESEFFGILQSKPNWSIDQIKEAFQKAKDRV